MTRSGKNPGTSRGGVPGRQGAPRRCAWRLALLAPALLLMPLLLLATCGPPGDVGVQLASLAPPRPLPTAGEPPRFTDSAFIAADGARLPLRHWLPDGPVKAVILALHGFGDYSHGFSMPATRWAARGIATFAYDQRGFGGAPGRGLWAG
jgi:acylglycerol lipase